MYENFEKNTLTKLLIFSFRRKFVTYANYFLFPLFCLYFYQLLIYPNNFKELTENRIRFH